jgi:hypothetical protein
MVFYLKPKYEGNKKSIQEKQRFILIICASIFMPMSGCNGFRRHVHAQDRLWQMELMRRIAPGACRNFWKSGLKE